MPSDTLKQFDLRFPGNWIDGADRDWAFDTHSLLKNIEMLLTEAVVSYSLFQPITAQNYREHIGQSPSPYDRCLNSIYAKAFVFALDGIEKLLCTLCKHLSPPAPIRLLCDEYKKQFGHLKHIRDSAIHIEDRGRGKTRHQQPVNATLLVLGSFIERRFMFTGEDGKQYEVEISDGNLRTAKDIIQKIINSYSWVSHKPLPGE